MLNKINNNTTDNVKNTVLEVKNNEVVFADHYLFDAMFQNINSSIESLEDEELMEREMLPGEKLLTLDEYVIRSVMNYPTLYLKYTYIFLMQVWALNYFCEKGFMFDASNDLWQ